MSANKSNMKALLTDFLKNATKKQPVITLDCIWGRDLKLSDQKNNFFVSKKLKNLLKSDEKVPDSKTFTITLSKWNFVIEDKKKGLKEVDLEVTKYTVKAVKEEIDFSKRTKDLFEYPEIKSKLKIENKAAAVKESLKKTKAKNNEKLKKIHAEVKVSKKEKKETPIKKKIAKNGIGKNSVTKTQISKKTAIRIEDKEIPKKKNGINASIFSLLTDISYPEIIQAREYDGAHQHQSATKLLHFEYSQMAGKASPHRVDQEGLHRLSSALGKANVQNFSYENTLPKSLKKKGLNYKEFLVGKDKGLVSAKEIVFNRNAIDLYLKEYEAKSIDAYK